MFKRKEIISAFDIEGNLIKLAQVGIGDTEKLLYRLDSRRAELDTPDSLAKALRSLVSDYKISTSRVIVSLPRYKVTVKTLKLPSLEPREIEDMVTLQAARQLPFTPDKIISGYKIIRKDISGYSDVMVALAHRNIVDNILSIFKEAGLDIERLTLSSEALGLWYLQRLKEDEKKSCICLADIGSTVLEILIIKEGNLDFTRSISFSLSEKINEKIVDELKRSLFTYNKNYPGTEITKLILTGKRSVINKEALILKKDVALPMVYIDALKSYPRKEETALPNEGILLNESFASVLSLGFNYENLEINLIPQEVRLTRISKLIRESLMMSIVLLLSIFIGMGGIVTKKFIDKKRYLTSINRSLEKTKPKVEELTRLREITQIIKSQIEITGSGIDILRELYSKIPPEISLSILDYEDSRFCLLRGTAQKLSDVFKFISILEESIYFENVKVRYATKRVVRNKELTDFEIICQLAQTNTDIK